MTDAEKSDRTETPLSMFEAHARLAAASYRLSAAVLLHFGAHGVAAEHERKASIADERANQFRAEARGD